MKRLYILLLAALPILFACTRKEQEVRVESVTLNQTSVELQIGKTLQLDATVSPSTATNPDVSWSSSNASVASVSKSGLVTAVKEGSAKIIAAADGKKAECAVTVRKDAIAVSEVKLNKTELTLKAGEDETLTATVLPDNATDKKVTWESSDKSIATVSSSGKVKAVKKGEATITAKAGDKTAQAKVTVLAPVAKITLSKVQMTLLIGESKTLTATVSPADADLQEPIKWTTSDPSVATVDENGKVTAVHLGEAYIKASADGVSGSCLVTVDYVHVAEITLSASEASIYVGETLELTATLSPENCRYKTVEWSSSDKNVATVNAEGKVTAVRKGSATITAKADGKEAVCKLTVLTKVTGLSLNKTVLNMTVDETENLVATLSPADATPREPLAWSSSAPEVASVEEGVVKALAAGTTTITVTADDFTASCTVSVSKPEYEAPLLDEVQASDKFSAADIQGDTDTPWYDNFSPRNQQFIYPHLLVAYVAKEWYWNGNMEYIIAGEIPETHTCENVGEDYTVQSHADQGYIRIKAMAPRAVIKACGGEWGALLAYVSRHPEKMFLVSNAADHLSGDTADALKQKQAYKDLKQLLEMDNVIICTSVGDNNADVTVTLEEDAGNPFSDKVGVYRSASVTSKKKNKYVITGYNANQGNVFFDDHESQFPYGFGQGNRVVPFIAGPDGDGYEETTTESAWSTSFFRTSLGNFLSVLLKTHPGVTLEGASALMQESYFRSEKMRYLDGGAVKQGGDWHFFQTDEFITDEILQKNAVDAAFASAATVVDLPSSGGLCYIGPGIRFETGGTAYEMTEANATDLAAALSTGKDIKWTFDRELARKYVDGSVDITVRVIDHEAQLVRDLTRTVHVGL